MSLSNEEFDTIIHDVINGWPPQMPRAAPAPTPAAGRRPYPVLRFAIGFGLFTIDAGLVSFFLGVSRAIWHW